MQNPKRESIFKIFFIVRDWLAKLASAALALADFGFALAAIAFFCLAVFDFGFSKDILHAANIHTTYLLIFSVLFCTKAISELLTFRREKWFAFLFNLLILGGAAVALLVYFERVRPASPGLQYVFQGERALILWSLALMITETHRLAKYIARINIPASFLFAGSFLIIILAGSGLLMLPKATIQPISYLDAFFTATSAVCVTGLTVVDTASAFTPMGKGILVVLIQIGGLGIMTFTAFFSFIFLGSASFRDRLMLKDFLSGETLGSLYKVVLKILLFTFFIEAAGAFLIYNSIEGYWLHKLQDSIFHAISAFCNAGFSVYPEGFAAASLRFNYPLQLTICALIVLGGIGFPLLLKLYQVLKYRMSSLFYFLTGRKKPYELIRLAVGERLALDTTIVLIIVGAVAYAGFEVVGSTDAEGLIHQGMEALFASVSARTAGFNVVDPALWTSPTVFLIMFLMWVGASPGSTGGGIKTTTLAVAARAVVSFLKGRTELDIHGREIGAPTIFRVLSIILLSMLFIFVGFMLLSIFEPAKPPLQLLFECVSAFSTTGLTTVDTKTLGGYAKIVLIVLMFVGRIGPVVLLTGFMITKTPHDYRLPVENIRIN